MASQWWPRRGGSPEERHLLALALDLRVEPEVRGELVEVGGLGRYQAAQVVGLEHVPVVLLEGAAQEHRASELEAHELGALG
jgi:ParB-like chromosome segregation protein Spo0J